MTNNDILIRLRYALDIKNVDMAEIFSLGRGAMPKRRSSTGRSCGVLGRENAGMSSEMEVRILQAEYLRFPG